MIATIISQFWLVIAGVLGIIAALVAAMLKGRRDAKRDAAAWQAQDYIAKRRAIDNATNADMGADAARDALAKRMRDPKP